jgi:hypothetical protein
LGSKVATALVPPQNKIDIPSTVAPGIRRPSTWVRSALAIGATASLS